MMDGTAWPRKGPHIWSRASPPLHLPQRHRRSDNTVVAARGNCTRQKMTCPETPTLLITFLELKVTPATSALKTEGGGREVHQSAVGGGDGTA